VRDEFTAGKRVLLLKLIHAYLVDVFQTFWETRSVITVLKIAPFRPYSEQADRRHMLHWTDMDVRVSGGLVRDTSGPCF
jgi:hypothetical protein